MSNTGYENPDSKLINIPLERQQQETARSECDSSNFRSMDPVHAYSDLVAASILNCIIQYKDVATYVDSLCSINYYSYSVSGNELSIPQIAKFHSSMKN